MSETSEVVRPILAALSEVPYCVGYRIQSGRIQLRGRWVHMAERGTPDIGCVVRGIPVFFEGKTAKGLVSEEQIAWHGRARRAGALIHVVRSPAAALEIVRGILANPEEARA